MTMNRKVVGIVGSYRKGGIIDSAVTEILAAAKNQGAETKKIFLQEHSIEFCTNCRACMQSPGSRRGECILHDDMEPILTELENADSLVLGAPTNIGNINALTRKFLERCACFAYWPWGKPSPVLRRKTKNKKAVLVSASGAPALVGRYFTGTLGALKKLAEFLGAKPVGVLWVGSVTRKNMQLPENIRQTAINLGRKLGTERKASKSE